MALSSSDAFIVLNELLQDYDTELLKATERLTEIKIITKELSDFMSVVSEFRTIKIVKLIGYLKFYSALVALL